MFRPKLALIRQYRIIDTKTLERVIGTASFGKYFCILYYNIMVNSGRNMVQYILK